MATPTLISVAPEQPSAELRRIQTKLRAVIQEDQDEPGLGASICDALHRIEDQLDRVAGLQELFEWYSKMP